LRTGEFAGGGAIVERCGGTEMEKRFTTDFTDGTDNFQSGMLSSVPIRVIRGSSSFQSVSFCNGFIRRRKVQDTL
jgi:hypothetical protein